VKPETIEIKNNTNGVSIENEEEQESRGDFHDFDYEQDDISFLKPPAQIGTSEHLIYKTECLLDLILQELIQIRNKLN
jgi:hypothetical protein